MESSSVVDLAQSAAPHDGTLHVGEIEIRTREGLVLVAGAALVLSLREFDLMVALAQRRGSIITRNDLYETVWGSPLRAGDRSVDVYVSKLRSKLRAVVPDRTYIHTHPGFGYRLQPELSQPFYITESRADQTPRPYAQLDPQPRDREQEK